MRVLLSAVGTRGDVQPVIALAQAACELGRGVRDPLRQCPIRTYGIAGSTSHALIGAARAVGRRAIVSRGWADLDLIDREPDCIAIGDVDHHTLFPRVAAVVHHGGAGTTVTAAGAGVPQVIVQMFSDQPFWASRVHELGLGTSIPFTELTSERLASALHAAGSAAIAEEAALLVSRIVVDGAAVAARSLAADVSLPLA